MNPIIDPNLEKPSAPAQNDLPSGPALDLPPAEAALAQELRALSADTHPQAQFVGRLQAELTQARRTSSPRRAYFPSLEERLRGLLQSAWGWTLPVGAMALLILALALLLQMRPRPGATIPAGDLTAHPSQATRPPQSTQLAKPTPSPFTHPAQSWIYSYLVQEGDTLEGIASLFDVTVQELLAHNRLGADRALPPGMRLTIPSGSVYPAPGVHYYYVQVGNTPAHIAEAFGVTVEALLQANGMVSESLPYPGMTLVIPSSAVYPPPGNSTYTVQEGDTLEGIAKNFGVWTQTLLDANHLFTDIQLTVGQSLLIPQGGAADDLIPGEPVDFQVCGESVYWSRPSTSEQEAKWWQDPRYVGAQAEYIQYPWTHDFFVSYGNASTDYDLTNLSGLWTLPESARAGCLEPAAQEAVVGLQKAEVWVLGLPVTGISREGNDYYIVGRFNGQGVQFIQFDRPQPQATLVLHFITQDGDELMRISEAESSTWPYPEFKRATATPVTSYMVQEGDTLVGIAAYFGVSTKDLLQANNLQSGDELRAGQSLIIPPQTTPSPTLAAYYTVQDGDTLTGIAAYFGVTVEALLQANNLPADAVLVVGQTLVNPSQTSMLATSTPAPHPLLAELQALVEKRQASLLTGPGWIYRQYHSTTTGDCGGVILPLGLFQPCEIDHYVWSELNERGEVVTSITRELDPSGNLFQEYVTRDGITRNFTFGYEVTAALTSTYGADWGFAAYAARAVASGASLVTHPPSVVASPGSQYSYQVLVDGVLQREAAFDPQTGALQYIVISLPYVPGQDVQETVTVLAEERVDQPPAEALALLERTLTPYQPLPPQGEPVPPGFDLAYSTLSLRTIAGDNLNNPSFWYGDIYADSAYLVGRVDFGGIAGGLCRRSPDGLKLAFNYLGYTTESAILHQLRWLDLSAPSEVQVPPFELQLLSSAAWGPDSARLAFVACDAANSCGLYTYDTLSGALQLLRPAGNVNGAPAPVWSADGLEIAFRANQDESTPTVVVDAASGVVNESPSWQPQFWNWSGFDQCELPPALAPTLPAAPADWLTYASAAYGFTFHYSPDWTLEEETHTITLSRGDLKFNLHFTGSGEQDDFMRTGVAAGDIVHGGHVSFLGAPLPRSLLVFQGKVKANLYGFGWGIKIIRGVLLFHLTLDDFSLDYEGVDLPAELLQQVDQIVESFAWIPVPPP